MNNTAREAFEAALPPLPKPQIEYGYAWKVPIAKYDYYTADQMREYARAARSLPATPAGFWVTDQAAKLTFMPAAQPLPATPESEKAERECRHCGWMCRPNPSPSKPWHPLAQPSQAEPAALQPQAVAWIRFCSDGTHEGPIMDFAMEDVRKRSGAWTPLYTQPASQPVEARADAKDAARYRWLRDVAWPSGLGVILDHRIGDDEWDDYIDRAIAALSSTSQQGGEE